MATPESEMDWGRPSGPSESSVSSRRKMKVLVRLILVTVMSLGGMSGYSLTVGEDTRVGIQTRQILSNLKSFAGDALGKVDWLKFTSDDEVIIEIYQPMLQACLDEIFLEK